MSIRTIICTLVGLLALSVLLISAPKDVASPRGMVLPAKVVRPAISADQVHIYHQAPSVAFTRLGDVRVEYKFSALDSASQDVVLQKAKNLAASIGANGIVVNLFVPAYMVGPVLTFMGTAIYVPSATKGSV